MSSGTSASTSPFAVRGIIEGFCVVFNRQIVDGITTGTVK